MTPGAELRGDANGSCGSGTGAIAAAVHDLRNCLNTIGLALDFTLDDASLPGARKEVLMLARTATLTMDELLQRILEHASPSTV